MQNKMYFHNISSVEIYSGKPCRAVEAYLPLQQKPSSFYA